LGGNKKEKQRRNKKAKTAQAFYLHSDHLTKKKQQTPKTPHHIICIKQKFRIIN
jgi:hypothetical protein